MIPLYNCHHDGDQYRITKFVDGNPESSYLCTHSECECPAGHRQTCRHRQMLPVMLERNLINTPWFLAWDLGQFTCDFEGNTMPQAMIEGTIDRSEPEPEPELKPAASWRRL